MKKISIAWPSVLAGALVATVLTSAIFIAKNRESAKPQVGQQNNSLSQKASIPKAERTAISIEKSQAATLGLSLITVHKQAVSEQLRAVATVVPDESRLSHIHTRVAGWIEKLYVSNTGETVKAGQRLADIFSQELQSSQVEYLSLRQGSGPASVALDSGRKRLLVLGMAEADIRAIEQAGKPNPIMPIYAPRSGIVVHRGISTGTAVDPSTELMTLADLSTVWVRAEIPESAASRIQTGTQARLDFPVSGLPPLMANVEFVDPVLSERTRTLKVRFSVRNANGQLRPGIFGSALFNLSSRLSLSVPRDAVVDTGETQVVYVAHGQGHFEPRTVRLGIRQSDRIEILDGLEEGDSIVASGVFLLDSESRLRASGSAGGHSGHGGTTNAAKKAPTSTAENSAAEKPEHQGHGGGQ
ncbi:MAG: efflux RND transporter periplasmic adaptor subunit [Agitococcus sp.]|nr:efflux RND transporter periplasmic adaptor subunit [Agitococcus sp.]